MQDNKKKIILNALATEFKKLRGEKSRFMLASENDISVSILSTIERGLKDPQLTTVFKIAEAFNIKASELIKLVEENLPQNFSLIDK